MVRKVKKAAIFLGGLVLATVLVELGLRIVELSGLWRVLPVAEVMLYGPDQHTGYALRAGVEGIWTTENRVKIKISPQGTRDFDTAWAKRPGEWRIALAGDSIVEALQVETEQTFAKLMENLLDRRFVGEVRVVNLGLSGAVPPVQVARMSSLGVKFDPDLMLYVVNIQDFASPLLGDSTRFPGYRRAGERGDFHLDYSFRETAGYRFRMSSMGKVYYWLMDHLRIVRLLNSRRNHGFFGPAADDDGLERNPGCQTDTTLSLLEALDADDQASEIYGRLSAFLRDVGHVAERHRSQAIVAVRGLASRCQGDIPLKLRLAEQLRDVFVRARVASIDMDRAIEGELRAVGGAEFSSIYGFGANMGSGHLNPFGHQIVSRALVGALTPWVAERASTGSISLFEEDWRQP